jgi:predicted MFS family arabinose efflux permease
MTPRELLLLLVLATVQFTHILDFVIIMPLEPKFHLTPQQFAWVVSVYGLGASFSGLLLAPLLDRIDRKIGTLTLYAGFAVSTLLCGLAPSYHWLLVARAAAGAFGGVVAACVLAIVADAFPSARRGTAMGAVMSAFSIASIAGIPLGLVLADHSVSGWRAPFVVLGVLSAGVLVLAVFVLPSIRGHLDSRRGGAPTRMIEILTLPRHLAAFALMISMVLSSFLIAPYLAAYNVRNVGLPETDLWMVYLAGGLATLVSMNVVGRLADRYNRLWLFRILALGSGVPVLVLTFLPHGTPILWLLLTTTAYMVLTSGRMVPAMTLISGAAEQRVRGSFMSLTTALQQMACGLAPLLGSLMLGETTGNEPLVGFHFLGLLAVGGAVLSVILAGLLRQAPGEELRLPTVEPEIIPLPLAADTEGFEAIANQDVFAPETGINPGEQCA